MIRLRPEYDDIFVLTPQELRGVRESGGMHETARDFKEPLLDTPIWVLRYDEARGADLPLLIRLCSYRCRDHVYGQHEFQHQHAGQTPRFILLPDSKAAQYVEALLTVRRLLEAV